MKKLIALLVFVVLVIIGAWSVLAYYHSFQSVQLTTDSGQSLTIYKGAYEGDGHTTGRLGEVVRTVTDSQPFKLKKGSYTVALADPKKQYGTTIFRLTVGDEPVKKTIHPDYSATTLATQLPVEEPAIQRVLQAKYPQIGKTFTLADGSLYGRGDWYGALLKPKDPATDIYRVVLQKKDNTWVLAVDQPEILISQIKYPNIPAAALNDVDNFKR